MQNAGDLLREFKEEYGWEDREVSVVLAVSELE